MKRFFDKQLKCENDSGLPASGIDGTFDNLIARNITGSMTTYQCGLLQDRFGKVGVRRKELYLDGYLHRVGQLTQKR